MWCYLGRLLCLLTDITYGRLPGNISHLVWSSVYILLRLIYVSAPLAVSLGLVLLNQSHEAIADAFSRDVGHLK